MIVTCPACQTRYLADENDLGGEAGRRVRCASCGNLWRYSAEAALIQTAVAEATAEVEAAAAASAPGGPTAVPSQVAPGPALRAEPGTQVQGLPIAAAAARPLINVTLPAAAVERAVGLGVPFLIFLGLSLVLLAILGRERVVAGYPAVGSLYQALHLVTPASSLELSSTLIRNADSLTVAGDIVNNTRVSEPVRRLRISLRDGDGVRLETRVVDPPVAQLPPGLTVHYETIFEHPSITATAADVAFAAE